MKTLWSRLTLECYRHPDDTEKMPWYAYPLTAVFIVGAYMFVQALDAAGF